MIVCRYNGAIYIAKSSKGIRDYIGKMHGKINPENIPIWHPNNKTERLLATTSNGRFTDIIRYENIFPTELTPKNLLSETFPFLNEKSIYYEYEKRNKLPSNVIFAEKDKAYILYSDGTLHELEDIFVDSLVDVFAIGIYDLKGITDPYEFIKSCYKTMELVPDYVMFPVVVLNTKDKKIKVIK